MVKTKKPDPELTAQACDLCNKMLEVINAEAPHPQIVLVALSILVGKVIDGVASAAGMQSEILEDLSINVKEVLMSLDRVRGKPQ